MLSSGEKFEAAPTASVALLILTVAREKTMFSVASAARVPATLGATRVSLRASARRGASVKARAFG